MEVKSGLACYVVDFITLNINPDLSAEDVTILASEIITYPWKAICMFAKALNVKMYQREPAKRKIWLVLGMLMEWEEKRREDDEPPKKVLAGTLLELESRWKKVESEESVDYPRCYEKPDFVKLARKMDIQGKLHSSN